MVLNLFLLVLLIGLTAFFVATEFAIVKVRTSKIDQLITEGKKGGLAAKKVVTHLDEYLSACQLGITVTALGLGWLGEPTVEKFLHPVFEYFHLSESLTEVLSFGIAFALVTFLHVVVGELAPKTVAIQKAETITLLFSGPIILFYKVMFPFIWMLNGSARIFVGLFGIKQASERELAHSEEEIRILLSESYESGEINKSELKYVNNIFEFDERIAREIMVPRTEMATISKDATFEEIKLIISSEHYTRYPVVEDGDKDNVHGFINVKEFLTAKMVREEEGDSLEPFIIPIIRVIETIPIHDLLVKMQKERVHIALLLDEYGGTSGLVTVEDIIEEIVGEIRDEFDEDERPEVQRIGDNHYVIDAKLLLHEVNELLDTDFVHDSIDTIGGWYLEECMNQHNPEIKTENGFIFTIHEGDGHHIQYLEVKKAE
ncbi:HlyC/CorC family transporter [Bacillus haikouensis]|uniref:hemolysin family protein n=1 Tax=Bacillus haikouensis TaxID=1510468 RepID=UPI001552999F|nr:hemolysin family protein [Bacillus haikouensis]NQD64430.1 HlyC/CorC family transporter [Bacillus haikouensis]